MKETERGRHKTRRNKGGRGGMREGGREEGGREGRCEGIKKKRENVTQQSHPQGFVLSDLIFQPAVLPIWGTSAEAECLYLTCANKQPSPGSAGWLSR